MNSLTTGDERKQKRVKIIGNVLIISIILATVELSSYVALRFGLLPKLPALFYITPPAMNEPLYNLHKQYQHPVVNWATEVPDEKRYSVEIESRPNLIFPNEDSACVSIYGDSFTFGDEVNDDEAWGNVLSGLLDCKVANYGQGGYGTDQAYLRFELNEAADKAPVNILAIYPDNILRNLNQYRPFLAGPYATWLGVKPRFIIENEELKLIPLPSFSYDELVKASTTPEILFKHETFIPGSAYGLPRYSFPYSLTIVRFVTSKKVRNYLSKTPSWINYLEEDHPADGLKIVNGIVGKFATVSEQRGQRPVLVIYPTASSYSYFKRTGISATQAIVDDARKLGITYLDLHEPFANHLGERNYCELLTMPESCTGHYNPEGNRAVAGLIKVILEEIIDG